MKKTIISFIAYLGSFVIAYAQPTITSADLPQPGYTYFTSTDTTPTIALGAPGSAYQIWDFTSLSENYPSVPTFDLTSKTPYAADFPASNIYTWGPAAMFGGFFGGTPVSSVGYATGYMFWKTDNSGYWITGFRADSGEWAGLNVYENPMELLIGTPCSYGDIDSNTARWELPINDTSPSYETYYVNHVTKTLTADAWGLVQLPNSISDTIIRIHEYIVKIDSFYLKNGTTILYAGEYFRDTLNNYLYLSPNYNYPLAHVHADVNNSVKKVEYYYGFVTNTENSVRIDNSGWSAIYLQRENEISIRCKGILPGGQHASFAMYDVSGKKIISETIRNNNSRIQMGEITSGIYFFEIKSETSSSSGKISIIRD